MSVTIVAGKIRGEVSLTPEKPIWECLKETSTILNCMYEACCKEIVSIKEGGANHLYRDPRDKEQLSAMIEVILSMDNKSANFALTRLVGNSGWNTLDGTVKEIKRAEEQVSKKYEKLLRDIEKLNPEKKDFKEKQAELNERKEGLERLKDQFQKALLGFKRVEEEGWAPLENLYTKELSHHTIDGTWSISQLSGLKEVRPLFNESVQALKSAYSKQLEYAEKIAAWNTKKEEIKNHKDFENYQKVSDALRKQLQDKKINKLTASEWVSLLQNTGESLVSWRIPSSLALSNFQKENAEKISTTNPEGRKNIFWRKELFKANPELKEFYDFHLMVEGVFGKPPKKPNFTLPDPTQHPRAIIWEKSQWKELLLPFEIEGKSRDRVEVRLPLLRVSENGLIEDPKWVLVSADRRLTQGVMRNLKGELIKKDTITGEWIPFEFGGIRLNIIKNSNGSDFRLSFTEKSAESPIPEWVNIYKKDRRNSPLPQNLIVVSFIHDPFGQGILKVAFVKGERNLILNPEDKTFSVSDYKQDGENLPSIPSELLFSDGRRTLSYFKENALKELAGDDIKISQNGILLSVDAPSTEVITEHRKRAEGFKNISEELKIKLGKTNDKLNELFADTGKTRKELRSLSNQKKKLELELASGKFKKEPEPDWSNRKKQIEESLSQLPSIEINKFNTLTQSLLTQKRKLTTRVSNNWNTVETKGRDRKLMIASRVIKTIEDLRKLYPEYQIALIIPEEKSAKPRKSDSRDSNLMKMASQEGGLFEKITQMAEGRQNQIPVFRVFNFGLSEVYPALGSQGVSLGVVWDKEKKTFRLPESTDEKTRVFLVNQSDNGKFSIREETLGVHGLIGSNAIRLFIDPSFQPTSATLKVNAERMTALMSNEDFITELNLRGLN